MLYSAKIAAGPDRPRRRKRSVLIEHLLDLLRVFGLRQRQLQQNARFCGFSVPAATKPYLASSTSASSVVAPVGTRDERTTATPLCAAVAGVKHRFIQVAVADPGADDALIAFGDQRLGRRIGGVGIVVTMPTFGSSFSLLTSNGVSRVCLRCGERW